jgi:hypothetical protein
VDFGRLCGPRRTFSWIIFAARVLPEIPSSLSSRPVCASVCWIDGTPCCVGAGRATSGGARECVYKIMYCRMRRGSSSSSVRFREIDRHYTGTTALGTDTGGNSRRRCSRHLFSSRLLADLRVKHERKGNNPIIQPYQARKPQACKLAIPGQVQGCIQGPPSLFLRQQPHLSYLARPRSALTHSPSSLSSFTTARPVVPLFLGFPRVFVTVP